MAFNQVNEQHGSDEIRCGAGVQSVSVVAQAKVEFPDRRLPLPVKNTAQC